MRDLDVINADLYDEQLFNIGTNAIAFNNYPYFNFDGEQEWENEENTDYENEEVEVDGGVPQSDLPRYRDLVRNKKLELKSQYGKGYFSIGECGIKPLPPETILNMPCLWDCSKEKNASKDCCTFNANQAEKRANRRQQILNWENCRAINKGIWVWGWRKKWREFKRDGGLAQLKLQSKGLYNPPVDNASPNVFGSVERLGASSNRLSSLLAPRDLTNNPYADMTCQELSNQFGIIHGHTFGTAPKEAIDVWITSMCNTSPKAEEEKEESLSEDKPATDYDITEGRLGENDSSNNKILGMPKDIAIGIGVAVLLIGGFALIRKKG